MFSLSVAIEKNQMIMELNFSRFAMLCPPQAILTVEMNVRTNVEIKPAPDLVPPTEPRSEIKKTQSSESEERKCCKLL